jgi:hypothetical protein
MAYDTKLADKVREFFAEIPDIDIEEKEMFNVPSLGSCPVETS